MISFKSIVASLLFFTETKLLASALEVGDTICTEGFIMDFYCINQGRMIDNGLVTLEQPDQHSVHCLVEVGSCVNDRSPFEVLIDPVEPGAMYSRGWRMTEASKQDMIMLAQGIGSCRTCVNGYDSSMQSNGFRAVLNATVLDLNEGSSDPPLIEVNEMAHSNNLGDNPCQTVFGMDDIVDTLGTNSTLFSTGVDSSLRTNHIVHASLMLTAWGFLLPLGAFVARFFKHRPNGKWYLYHKTMQVVGLILALAGWIIALHNFDVFADVGYNNYRHGICGMVTMVLGLLQPLNALIRPHPPSEGEIKSSLRQLWEVVHKGSGYVAILMAAATIILGTKILPEPDDKRAFQVAYGILLGVLLLAIVLMVLDKKNHADNTTIPKEKKETSLE
eukprot:scaffold24719_cov147-Cylindrotheca_fusiformis.AAC.1